MDSALRVESIKAAADAEYWAFVREYAPNEGETVCFAAALCAVEAEDDETVLALAAELGAQNLDRLTQAAVEHNLLDLAQALTQKAE